MAVDSLVKASTPRLLGTHPLWNKPGLKLPDYIEHIASRLRAEHGLSDAVAIAVSAVKRWAAGGGKVDAGTRAAAQKALAEWEALKATHGGKKHLSNGAAVSIDLAFNPQQQRAAAGTSTGGQWAAQGGTSPTKSVQTKQAKAWAQKQVGHYPPGMTDPQQRQQWDNWFKFFGLPAAQQRALIKGGKAPKKPKGAPKGPKAAKPGALPISTAGWAPMPTGLSNGVPVNTVDLADANTTVGGLTDSRSMVVNTLLTRHVRSAHGMKTPKGTTPGRVVKLHKALHARGNAGHSHKGASMSNATQQSFDLATLTTKARKQTRSSSFGLPSERKYPMPDKSHAANAKARAAQQLKAGRITQSQHDRIVRMANKLLGNSSAKSMSNPMADPAMAMGRVLGLNLDRRPFAVELARARAAAGRKMTPYRPKGAERQRVVEHLRAARALHRSGRTKQASSIHTALIASATNRARAMPDGSRRSHTGQEAKIGLMVLSRQSLVKGSGLTDGKVTQPKPGTANQAKARGPQVPTERGGRPQQAKGTTPRPQVAGKPGRLGAVPQGAGGTAPSPQVPKAKPGQYPREGVK